MIKRDKSYEHVHAYKNYESMEMYKLIIDSEANTIIDNYNKYYNKFDYVNMINFMFKVYDKLFYLSYDGDILSLPGPTTQLMTHIFSMATGGEYKPIDRDIVKLMTGFVEVNENSKNIWYDNVTKIEFDLLYKNSFLDVQRDDIEYSYSNYIDIFKSVDDLRFLSEDTNIHMISKMWLIMQLGMFQSDKCLLRCNSDISWITTNNIGMKFRKLSKEFEGNLIYIDTYTIYVKYYDEIKLRFDDRLEELFPSPEYLYYKDIVSFFIYSKKKYIEKNEFNNITVKGFKKIHC